MTAERWQPTAALAQTTPWAVVLDAYLDAALDSPSTRRNYRRDIAAALTWLGVAALAELTGALLAAYRVKVVGSALAPGSRAQPIAALRSFLRWGGAMGAPRRPDQVVAAALRTPAATVRKPYQILAEPEIALVLAAAPNARDRALLAELLGAGLRAAEAAGLDVADVLADQEGGAALHVRGKGRKERIVPIQGDVLRYLRAYLAATGRTLGAKGPLFRAHDRAAGKLPRHRLTTRAAGYVVDRCAAAAGVDAKRISPHSLRHTFALRSLRQRRDVIAVRQLPGPASLATTQRYLEQLGLAELRAAVPTLPLPAEEPGGERDPAEPEEPGPSCAGERREGAHERGRASM